MKTFTIFHFNEKQEQNMIYLTISKLEAMFRLQRLVTQSDCRFFQTGSIHPSQLIDITCHFENKYSVSNDHNARKRSLRAGQPIWHLVWWFDVTNPDQFHYYLLTNGYDEVRFPAEQKNLLRTENLEDLYNGDLLTFGRYVLGQYVEYQAHKINPVNGTLMTTAESYEYRYPEKTALFFKPKDFNYVVPPKDALEKSKEISAIFEQIRIDQNDIKDLKEGMPEYEVIRKRLESNRRRFNKHVDDANNVGERYENMELNNNSKVSLISKDHPNFRKDLDYFIIQKSLENDINVLHKQKDRLSRAFFLEFLSRSTNIENLDQMEHGGLVDLWLKIETRRITLYYNRLCENRSRKVRWTWYLREASQYDIRSQLRLAVKHMGRNTDELVKAIRAVHRMAGFRGVRHQLGKLLAKAKRDAKHAQPKLYSHLNLNMDLNYIRTIPITIHSMKQYHDECITASIKHERRKTIVAEREQKRASLRQSLRDSNDHFRKAPVAVLDEFINQHFNKIENIQVTNDDKVRFVIQHDAMDSKYLDFTKVQALHTAEDDLRVKTENMYEEDVPKWSLEKIESQSKARLRRERAEKRKAKEALTPQTKVKESTTKAKTAETSNKLSETDLTLIADDILTTETKIGIKDVIK